MPDLENVLEDVRYLLERGYPRKGAISYVSNHYRLNLKTRHVVTRVVYSRETAANRRAKTVSWEDIKGKEVWVDGYNVMIGVETALRGEPIYLCDDGFIRDTRGVFRNYRGSLGTQRALDAVFRILVQHAPSRVEILFDAQISKSGELARWTGRKMQDWGIEGSARTSRHVDLDLKQCGQIVATSDSSIIDAVREVADLLGAVLDHLQIQPVIIKGSIQ